MVMKKEMKKNYTHEKKIATEMQAHVNIEEAMSS